MAKDPSMPFYVNDWLSSPSVACMSLEQQGAYLRLLCYCWASQNAELPSDDKALSVLSGMGEGWFNGGSHLVRVCFVEHPNQPSRLTNKKLYELWQERVEWRRKSAEAGRKSGESRRKSSCGKEDTKRTNLEPTLNQPSTKVQPTHEPNTNSSSSSSSSSSILNSTHTLTREHRDEDWKHLSDAVQRAIRFWNRYWVEKHGCGHADSPTKIEAMLLKATSAGWSDEQIVESITTSVAWGAQSWRDPEADHDKATKARINGRNGRASAFVQPGANFDPNLRPSASDPTIGSME